MFSWSVKIISGLDSQSKFQMFTLFSGRHVGDPWRYTTNIAVLQAATILVTMASEKKLCWPKFWRKLPIGDQLTTSYRLRNSEMRLALPQPRTDYVRKSFSYSGAVLWNSLPTDIRVSKTLGEFKMKLSNFSFEWTNDTASLKSSTFIFIYFLSN